MTVITVKIVWAGEVYPAQINTEAHPKAIAKGLAEDLTLEEGNYRLALVDSTDVTTGSTLELLKGPDEVAGRILRNGSQSTSAPPSN